MGFTKYFTEINESPILLEQVRVSKELQHHLDSRLSIHENIFRPSSETDIALFAEARVLYESGKIELRGTDLWLVENTDIGETAKFEGELVPLDYPLLEAEYKGRDVELNQPQRGGPKKFYVYVKNPETGNVIKVNFGDGGDLRIKTKDKDAQRNFWKRHNCSEKLKKGDKTTPGYWSCAIGRYAKRLFNTDPFRW